MHIVQQSASTAEAQQALVMQVLLDTLVSCVAVSWQQVGRHLQRVQGVAVRGGPPAPDVGSFPHGPISRAGHIAQDPVKGQAALATLCFSCSGAMEL